MSQVHVTMELPTKDAIVGEKAEQNESRASEKQETEIYEVESKEGEEEGEEDDDTSTEEEYVEEDIHGVEEGEEEESMASSETDEDDKFAKQAVYLKRQEHKKMEKDFFKDFFTMLDINRIKLDDSVISVFHQDLDIIGHDEEEEEEQSEMLEEESMKSTASSEFSEFEYDFYCSEEETADVVKKKVSDENLFEKMVKMDEKPVIFIIEPDLDELERLMLERTIKSDTTYYLQQLIEYAVETSEYVDPKKMLRENLNKVKLFKEAVKLLKENYIERVVNDYANQKVLEYYRRLKSYRPIRPDPPDQIEYEMERYKEAIASLDHNLGREVAAEEIIQQELEKTTTEFKRIEKVLKKEISDLVGFIRKTLSNRGTEHFARFVDARLVEMASLRSAISKVREVLIRAQHVKGGLLSKIQDLETIDGGYSLRDYEGLVSEVSILKIKLEERIKSLERQRLQFEHKVNSLAHIKEKETIVFHAMMTQTDALNEATEIKNGLRVYIHQLKTKRIRMKKQIPELSLQCGLIDKPDLCLDYCITEDRCKELKQLNKEKEEKLSQILKKINICEQREKLLIS